MHGSDEKNIQGLIDKSDQQRNCARRHTSLFKEALETANNALAIDPLNFNTINELYLLSSKVNTGKTGNEWLIVLKEKLRNEPDSYLETATRYGAAGFFDEAMDFLGIAAASTNKVVNSNPMIYYYAGYYAALNGVKASAVKYFQKASQQLIDYVFPYGETSVKALNAAIALNPGDANAHYFLGNAYAANQPEKSIVEWQKAISLNSKTAIFYRNLAFVQANYTDNISGAVKNIMKAISLNEKEARYFSEADNYMSFAKTLPEKIASFVEQHAPSDNNDVKTIDIRLKNFMGDYDRSVSILEKLNFRTEEGAAFNVHVYWFDAHLLRGIKKMNAGAFNEAEKDFLRAMEFPDNLESDRDAKTGVALYFLGINNKLNRNTAKAKEYFTKMVEYTYEQGWGAGSFPEINFYKGLACRQLGKDAEAEKFFALLISNGDEGLRSRISGQYSRSSGDHGGRVIPSLARRKTDNDAKANAIYSKALEYLGLGEEKKADTMFKETSSINPTHLGAKMHTSGEWKMASASPK